MAIDANGNVSQPATTSALGAFTLDVSGMTPPFILSVTGTANGKQVMLNSIATSVGQTVNITPLTDLILSTAAGQPGESKLAELCTPNANEVSAECLTVLQNAVSGSRLADAITSVKAMIAPINSNNTDPLTGAFTADGTGMDQLLDRITVAPALNGGETATVTLIATNTPLGQVAFPSTAGDLAIPAATAPDQSVISQADAASNVFNEVRQCLGAFNELYKPDDFQAPTADRVSEFFDEDFRLDAGADKATVVGLLAAGGELANPGFSLVAVGLSPFDMSPLSADEITLLKQDTNNTVVSLIKARSAAAVGFVDGQPVSAWVRIRPAGDAGLANWKMKKSQAYEGCPGGWKLAGDHHLDMHMNARIQRNIDSQGITSFTRWWPFHAEIETVENVDPNADTIIVRGPGINRFGGDQTPVGVKTSLRLTKGINNLDTQMVIEDGNGFYGNGEAIRSCLDLVGSGAAIGTLCIDESQVAPGKLYSWVVKNAASNTIYEAFAFQTNAVPLSKAFAEANQSALFATLTSATPASIDQVVSGMAGVSGVLDDFFTFTFTQQQDVYGSHMDNCRVGLNDSQGNLLLVAEMNSVGRETSCTFSEASLNSGSLTKPEHPENIKFGYISLDTSVLGNQATSSQPYPLH